MTSEPYDCTFTIGSTVYGFQLVSPEGQSKQLTIDEVQGPFSAYSINRLQADENRNHGDFDSQQDAVLAQADLSGGLGDLEYNEDNDTYWWGVGVSHVAGKYYPPPPTTTLTFSSGAATWNGSTSFLTSTGTRYDFAWQDTRLYRRDASNTSNTWSLVYTANVAITDFTIVNGTGIICVPARLDATSTTNTDFWIQSDPTAAATWTPTSKQHTAFSDTLGKPVFMSTVRGTTYAAVNGVNSGSGVVNRKVFYSTDPSADSWLGPIDTSLTGNKSGPPGDQSHAFLNLVPINDYLFALKRDAGYAIDSQQEVTEVLWQWKDKPSVNQFKYVAVGGETLYYSVTPEVYAYDPSTGRNVPVGISRRPGFSCQDILGVAADNQYLYILAKVRVPRIRAAASAALFRCLRTGASMWSFEVLWEDTSVTAYSGLYASVQGTGTRVYWFLSSGVSSTHMDIPADWDETTSGSFATAATLYTSIWRTGWANFIKRWLWVATKTQTLDASNTIAIAYSTDEGSTFTTLATLTGAGLAFNDFTAINSETLVLRFTFVCAGTVAPVLNVYDLHGRVRWRYLQQGQAAVRIADNIELNNQTRDGLRATDLRANLETLRTSDATITYNDFLGNSFPVSIDHISYHPSRHEKPERNGLGITELEAAVVFSRASSGA